RRSADPAGGRPARRLRRDRQGQEGRVDRSDGDGAGRHEALDDVPDPPVDAGGDRRHLSVGSGFLRQNARTGARALVLAFGVVLLAGPASSAAPPAGRTIDYWVAAVPVSWNIVPNGRDGITGETIPLADSVMPTVVYRRYSADWKKPIANVPSDSAD